VAEAALAIVVPPSDSRRTADRVFYGSLVYTVLLTLAWAFFMVTQRDGGTLFPRYAIDRASLAGVAIGFLFFNVFWGWLWYLVRAGLLRRVAGFSKEELKVVFGSRMDQPFDVRAFIGSRSERRVRIIDMIGRRGRFVTLGALGFFLLYLQIQKDPKPGFLTLLIQNSLFEAVVFSWLALALYYSSGFVARMFYGAQSRIMDGTLARANCLLITTLWSAFKFVMVPIGARLEAHFPPTAFAAVFIIIWGSYLAGDAASEIVGSTIGRQKLQVWGMGDVNRKSIAGTVACFVVSFVLCAVVVGVNHLPAAWLGLGLVISVSNTALELFSPRGTDDFTMATAGALLCWAFGAFFY
jgi:dolichol kinase